MEPSAMLPTIYRTEGLLLQGVGGRYTIQLDRDPSSPLCGMTVVCRAKGAFRHDGISPLPGDRVVVEYGDTSFHRDEQGEISPSPDGSGIRIAQILPRRCTLIRPPMANLDTMFVTFSVAAPAPLLPMVDKLLCVCDHDGVTPVVVITKRDLDPDATERLLACYRLAGFPCFALSTVTGEGVDALRQYISEHMAGKIAAFAGASGVGKSTLMNLLFPRLSQQTGMVSQKTERGKHTTRQVTLFPAELLSLDSHADGCYIADTPGFSLLDFESFDFFEKDDLPFAMREFRPYLGQCRYTDCTHTKEQDCAMIQALQRGEIAASRHESFLIMYRELKDKKPWEKAKKP